MDAVRMANEGEEWAKALVVNGFCDERGTRWKLQWLDDT
jgi:hypothetical protein